jgi:hypothetical protein
MDHLLLHCLVTRMLCSLTSNLFGVHHLLNLYQNLPKKKKKKNRKRKKTGIENCELSDFGTIDRKESIEQKGLSCQFKSAFFRTVFASAFCMLLVFI